MARRGVGWCAQGERVCGQHGWREDGGRGREDVETTTREDAWLEQAAHVTQGGGGDVALAVEPHIGENSVGDPGTQLLEVNPVANGGSWVDGETSE